MKVKELIANTPEMTEEKLLKIMDSHLDWIPKKFFRRLKELHKEENNISKMILNEYDLVNDKKSYLTKSQRDMIVGFVGVCAIEMVKDNGEH